MHQKEIEIMRKGSKYQTAAWITPEEVMPKPNPGWRAQDYDVKPICNETLVKQLIDGDTLKLGSNLTVDVMHFPGHSKVT